MTTSWSIDFSPTWPFLSQLTDTPPDKEVAKNPTLDCGETCVSMVTQWLTGVCIDPDIIKDIILGGENATGPTSAFQIRSFLSSYCGTPTTRLFPQGTIGTGSLTNLLWTYLVAGKPVIVLKRYSDTNTSLHWVVVIGLDPDWVTWADPWTGTRVWASYADIGNLYAGALIGIDRPRDMWLSS